MENRTEELRSLAGQCIALLRTTTDPQVRASLVLMAQRFHQLATSPQRDFNSVDQPLGEHETRASERIVHDGQFGMAAQCDRNKYESAQTETASTAGIICVAAATVDSEQYEELHPAEHIAERTEKL